jgi:Rrf2 family protein
MLSQTAQYALRALIHLARGDPEHLVLARSIAEAEDIPLNYLSKVLNVLSRAGILGSSRGSTGGFRLTVAAEELYLFDVVALFDPMIRYETCILGTGRCSEEHPCSAHPRWSAVSRALTDFLKGTTLADILEQPTGTGGPDPC